MLLHYYVSKPKARVKLFIVDIDYPVNKNESGFIWEFVCSAHNCWAPLSNSAVCAQVKCAPQEFCQHGNVIKNKQRNRDECVGGSVASQQSSSMCCRAGTSSWSKRKTDMETSAQTHNLSTWVTQRHRRTANTLTSSPPTRFWKTHHFQNWSPTWCALFKIKFSIIYDGVCFLPHQAS